MKNVKINNKPQYANEHKFIVARFIDDELWFYGAYNDNVKAQNVANEINGIVINN